MPPKRKFVTSEETKRVTRSSNSTDAPPLATESTDESPKGKSLKKTNNLSQYKFKKAPIKLQEEKTVKIEKVPPIKPVAKWEPQNWEEVFNNLHIMRAYKDAPVDSMGCHKCADPNEPPAVFRYQILIALMLSPQTKDQVTFEAMQRLKEHGLNIENILQTSDEKLGELIKPVGFWKTKVKYVKKTTQELKDKYKGDIPDSVESLCKLTGVGPKIAHICMNVAWDKITGIGVDTHVHRICNRLGWVKKPTNNPEQTRKELESWLPAKYWRQVNHVMVGFGQTVCTPTNPSCDICHNNDICPYGKSQMKKKVPADGKSGSKTSKAKKGDRRPVFKEGSLKKEDKFDPGEGPSGSQYKAPNDYLYEINIMNKFIVDHQEALATPQIGGSREHPVYQMFSDEF